MNLTQKLLNLVRDGKCRIGEIWIQSNDSNENFTLSHHSDSSIAKQKGYGNLKVFTDPGAARDLSTHAEDGSYRFVKAQTNLRAGWVMVLESPEALRMALDHFYPASVGLFIAMSEGTLEVQNLRDKLERQTGMYRFARTIRDDTAQKLVREFCGPAHQCARRILWKIDENTPLEDSEASRYDGLPAGIPTREGIPLLCREACNHFVGECRQAAKTQQSGSNHP